MNDLCKKWNLNFLKLPRHVGIVMDGNGRWAKRKNLPRLSGHQRGVQRVREITEFCGDIGISALTLYAFSEENWKRPTEEVTGIMALLELYIKRESQTLIEKNVRFRMIGNRKKISENIMKLIEKLERNTLENTGLELTIALSYGSHQEMASAAQKIAQKIAAGVLSPDNIDCACIEEHLETAELPDLDLFIRTSGEFRLSNFLLWQAAYAELFFETAMWPSFSIKKFVHILKSFELRDRRFGALTCENIKGTTQVAIL